MVKERLAFVGQIDKKLKIFLQQANLTPIEIPKDMPPKDKPSYIFEEYLSILERRRKYVYTRNSVRVDDRDHIEDGEQELFWVIEDNQEEFLESAIKLAKTKPTDIFSFNRQLDLRDFFNSLILIKLNSETPCDTIDPQTGIRIARITDAEIERSRQIHPTPNS